MFYGKCFWLCALSLLGLGQFFLDDVAGQSLPVPRLTYVSPQGGQAGSTVEVTVTGQDLDDVEGLHFSFPGAKVELVGAASTAPPAKDMKKGGGGKGPQLTQKFKVTIPPNAPLGIHDLRITSKGGVSNPRAFVVGDLKEVAETEPNDDVPKAQKVDLNTTINGLVPTGTDVDYYLFTGKKGQRVVVSCLSTSIDSKLPAMIQLYSVSGSYLAFSKGYQGNDALLDAVLPEDGDYYVRLCSFTYTLGGPDYYYRMTISTAPWLDAVFPPIVEAGKDTKVTLFGRNLPGGANDPASVEEGRVLEKATVSVKAPATTGGLDFRGFVPPPAALQSGFEYRVKNAVGSSNPVLIGVAGAPIVLDNFDNDSAEKAQKVTFPCEIGGIVEKKGDRDWYIFTAKKGQIINIDAFSDRLGSPTDLYFILQNDKGTTITEQDENTDITANQFYTRSEDPARYRFTVPADGDYKLMVTSRYAFAQAGPRQTYIIKLTADDGDFQLVAMGVSPLAPESVVVGQAGNQVYHVFAFRQGTFTGDITLSGDNLPPGVTIRPQTISGTQKQASLVVSAAPEAPAFTGGIKVLGTAVIDGKKVVREMRGASITWPVAAATPTISRLDRELVLAVRDKAPYTLVAEKEKIDVPQGDKITIPVKVNRLNPNFKEAVNVVVINPPTGFIAQALSLAPGKDSGNLVLDIKGTPLPGNFTLAIRGQTVAVGAKPNQNPKGPQPANFLQATAPVSLTVVPKTLGKLSVTTTNPKVSLAKESEIILKVARLNDYTGPFKVEVIDAKGLKVAASDIAANQDEAKLIISAAGAPAGASPVISIRATAMFNAIPIVHETKFNVNVTK